MIHLAGEVPGAPLDDHMLMHLVVATLRVRGGKLLVTPGLVFKQS